MQPQTQQRPPHLPQSAGMSHTSYQPLPPTPHTKPHKPKRRSRFKRFVRGYLMTVGSLTTCYVLIKLLVIAFVEIAKWLPNQPTL